jgi:prevent-host-death family protein
MKATAKDLRFHAKEILESVMRGEEVTITYRGKPSAKIVPMKKDNSSKVKSHKLFGIWSDYQNSEDVNNYVRALREGRNHDN